jgi:cephalosporin hydroxylase
MANNGYSFVFKDGDNRVAVPQQQIVDVFHQIYYGHFDRTISNTHWMGVPLLKCPLDLWVYQEILFDLKPDLVIETGTFHGGSALYLANLMDLLDKGEVITIDVDDSRQRPRHPRITYITASSTDPEITGKLRDAASGKQTVMAILDSDHSRDHVLNEMRIYSELVTPESYLVVEDTNINGHPVRPGWGNGPMEAVNEFMNENTAYVIDRNKEKFFLTMNPKGFLKRVA